MTKGAPVDKRNVPKLRPQKRYAMSDTKIKTPQDYANYARELFMQGYNCSQALVCAFSDFTELDDSMAKKLASPFGGGMGRLREVCGGVSGMFIVLGLLEGYDEIGNNEKKTELYAKVQQLAEEFEKRNGSYICRELLGLGQGKDSPIPEARTKEYYEKRPCPDKVASAAEILAEYLLTERTPD